MNKKIITFKTIANVISEFNNPKDLIFACEKGLKTQAISKIKVNKEYAHGLMGLKSFSHVWVIYYLHLADKTEIVTMPGTPEMTDLPKVGVFASRSQYRPNKIALRLAKIVKITKNIIHVSGLDAINGTEVLDIKPYVPGFDRPKKYKCAPWYSWFEKK